MNNNIKVLGEMEQGGFTDRKRVYDPSGIAPTIVTAHGGNFQPKVVQINKVIAPLPVKVRKYPIDSEELSNFLRTAKAEKGISNKAIADALGVPLTKVEHWFRNDDGFAIPDADYWYGLKEMLGIHTDKYDQAVTEFEVKDCNYEKHQRIHLTDGLAPTITAMDKENILEIKNIVAMRGREDGQRLEAQTEAIANTITTVQKDIVHIKQATKSGSVECVLPGIADLNYVTSTTRRGRVQEKGQICPAITTENIPNVIEPWVWEIDGELYRIRIRKLTPKECWRLMDFSDEDYEKAAQVNSKTQLYKEAGNSIVQNCLVGIIGQLIPGRENVYKERFDEH